MTIERLTEIQLTALQSPNAPWAKDFQALGLDMKRMQEAIRRVLQPLADQQNSNANPGGAFQLLTQKDAKNGYAGLDANARLKAAELGPQGIASPGYLTLPGGLIVQWGQHSASINASLQQAAFNFPLPFPNACWSVVATAASGSTQSGSVFCAVMSASNVQFQGAAGSGWVSGNTLVVNWIAVGD